MNVYPIDTLRHFTPLVLISGLAIPDPQDEKCQRRVWKANVGDSLKSHPLLEQGEQLATSPRIRDIGEEDVIMPELFWKFAQKSSDLLTWNPASLDIARHRTPHLLNIQFLTSENDNETEHIDYVFPPIKSRQFSTQTQQSDASDNASIASRQSTDQSKVQYPSGSFHSPLSPLTSTSDLYPDGLISDKWLQKYLHLYPSTFISIHLLDSTPQTKEEEAVADEKLTSRINALKNQLLIRDIKLIVIIVSETLPNVDPTLNDRIYYLRKNTGLAPRTGLFFLPPSTEVELETLVETVCQISFNYSIEFYTHIAKQVRKKRGGKPKTLNISPEDAALMTTSPLSNAGWEIRYSYKLSVLAELRQEIESCTKAYEMTYEMALELFETLHPLTETSARRWCEFRMFLDVIALRIVKLHFYAELPHIGYKKFLVHMLGVSNILDTRGFSRDGFSYKYWRATQYMMLASLVDRTAGRLFPGSSSVAPNADEQVPAECLPRSAILYLTAVHLFFDLLNGNYKEIDQDTNSISDPYMDKASTDMQYINGCIKTALKSASRDFSFGPHPNERSVGYTMYLLGEHYLLHDKNHKSAQEQYQIAAKVYRKEAWNPLLQIILHRLMEVSQELEDPEEYSLSELELSLCLNTPSKQATPEELISKLKLSDVETIDISDNKRNLSLYSAEYSFLTKECFLGRPTKAQLAITCNYPSDSSSDSTLHTLNEFQAVISGELASIRVVHNESLPINENGYVLLSNLKVQDESASYDERVLTTEANLSFKPGQTIAFEFVQIPKKLGDAKLAELIIIARHDNYHLKMNIPMAPNMSGAVPWYDLNESTKCVTSRFVRIPNPFKIKLSPRPSLLTVALDVAGPVALGERFIVNTMVASKESEEVILDVQAAGLTSKGDAMEIKWVIEESEGKEGEDDGRTDLFRGLRIPAGATKSVPLEVQVPAGSINSITLEFFISYYSATDEDTLIKDNVVMLLTALKPFIVNFDVNPRFHPEPWPNFFIPTTFSAEDSSSTFGITPSVWKKWELCASVLCLCEGDDDPVEVLRSELEIVTPPEAICNIVERPNLPTQLMKHNDSQKISYMFNTGRTGEKEIRQVSAEAHLKVFWQRPAKDGKTPIINEYSISPVRLNLPLIEPRVIVDIERSSKPGMRNLKVIYHIENSTNHILTYTLTMGSNDSFAFQGPKQLTVRMLPFTRRSLDYVLMPLTRGLLPIPTLKVFDIHYKKTLVPLPATSELKIEKKNLWVVC